VPRANEIKVNVEQKYDYLNPQVAVNVARQYLCASFDSGSIRPEYARIFA